MQLKFALIASLIALAHAFQVPANQPDGAYLVTFDETGTATVTAVEPPTVKREPLQPVSARLSRRQLFPSYTDGCTGYDISNHDEYTADQNYMDSALDGGLLVPGQSIYYVTSGNTILALCNYSNNAQGGNSGEIAAFNGIMDRYCGSWRSGWVFIGPWNKTYWRTVTGDGICTNI
jgi:hypothetical protein